VKRLRGSAETQTVATYGFNVPCQRFILTSNITRDRRLPVVDEFVLRLLKVAERLSAGRLGSFLGFSPKETATVMGDLQVRGLIKVSGDDLELAPSAQQHFKAAGDGTPRIVELETWVDRLWFDLVSRNMMAPERTRPLDNLIDLKPLAAAKSMPTAFAREAFQQNFAEFLRKVRHINNPDTIALYSVSDVTADRYGSVVLSGTMELQLDPEPRLLPRLLEVEVEDLARYRPLHDAMHDAVRRLTVPEPSQAGLAEFRRLSADATVASHQDRSGGFRPAAWLADPQVQTGPDRVPFFGASYLERNLSLFVRMMERRGLPRLRGKPPTPLQLRWFRPNGSAWGASHDIQRVVPEIATTVKKALSADWELRSTLIASASARGETHSRFRRVFDCGLAAPPSHLAACTEILIVEGVAAMVLTQVAISPVVSIPVGLILGAEADLGRLQHVLKLDSIDAEHDPLWKPAPVKDQESGAHLESE
jgi:hypothetical protein